MLKPVLGSQLNLGSHLARGLVGYWLFNEGSGNKVFDLSGNGNTGILTGTAPSWTAGKFGSAVLLPGTDECINCGNVSSSLCSGDFTICIAPKFNVIGQAQTLVDNRNSNNDGVNLLLFSSNSVWLQIDAVDNNTNSTLSVNTLYHIAALRRGTNVEIYINGISQVLSGDGPTAADGSTTADVIIGKRAFDATVLMNGQVDYAMLYNRALSASEIALLFRAAFQI